MTNTKIYLCIIILGVVILSGCSNNNIEQNKNEIRKDLDLSCPNCSVLFLDMDLLRADYVGLINPESKATPNIDKFFQNSIIFEDVSSPSGSTKISNYATLTSRDGIFIRTAILERDEARYNQVNDSTNVSIWIKEKVLTELTTIAQVLQSNEYYTINVNEDYFGQSGVSQSLGRGFTVYWDRGIKYQNYGNITAIQQTIEYLKERNDFKDNSGKSKFFILMRSDELHRPYRYPSNRSMIIDSRIKIISNETDYYIITTIADNDSINVISTVNYSIGVLTPENIDKRDITRKVYQQQMEYIDEQLGEIFDYLEKNSLTDNTIIILYSNHGEGLYDNNIYHHGVPYQSCVHVPLLILHPKVHEQIRIEQPVSIIDLTPTIYDIIGVESKKDIDGISLVPTIINNTYSRTIIYGAEENAEYVRIKDMKLIVWDDGSKRLYNISSDPYEEQDISNKYSEIVNQMYRTLTEHQISETKKVVDRISEIKAQTK